MVSLKEEYFKFEAFTILDCHSLFSVENITYIIQLLIRVFKKFNADWRLK